MAQLTYPQDLVNAFEGMLADTGMRNDVLSRVGEEAVSFPHGVALVAGTDPDKQVLLPTGAAKLVGVAVHSHANEVGADDLNLVDQGRYVGALHVGRIYVKVEEAVTPASPVFVRTAAGGGGSQLGAFRASGDTATALAASGARFITSGAGGSLVVLEIDADAAIA